MVSNGPGDFTVLAEATGRIDTSIAQVIGKKNIDLRANAQVRWGFKALELALALDNTGSMAAKNKMVELKSAVKLLFSILKTNSKVPGDTKIAVIPFSTVVNVGAEHVDAPWMTFDATVTKANWTGCVADRDQPNDVKRRSTERRSDTVSCRSMRVAGEDAAPHRGLGCAERHGRHHDAERHDQRDHRDGLGLACAHAEGAVQSGAGGQARRRQGDDPV